MRIVPATRRSMPKIARAISDRPAPTRPAKPTISPRLDVERDGEVRISLGAQRVDAEITRAGRRLGSLVLDFDFAPDHQADHVVVRQFLARERAGDRAIAQHDGAIGNGLHFAEPVRDVDDSHALLAQIRDDLVQPGRLGRASGSRSARP